MQLKGQDPNMAYATLDDLIEVEPDITEYGVLDFDRELEKSEQEVNRILSVRWWPQYAKLGRKYDIRVVGDVPLIDVTKLDPTQWRQATVYHALAYHICPKLTQFTPEADKFQVMMNYYDGRFEHEIDLAIREGVKYDDDGNGEFEDDEKIPDTYLRLKR